MMSCGGSDSHKSQNYTELTPFYSTMEVGMDHE